MRAACLTGIARLGSGRFFLLGLCLVAGLLGSVGAGRADSAQYFYDPAGRLTGVLDPVNGSAQYTYDQSGNITAIVNNSISTLTVLQASPRSGPVGTTVTIAGSAFGNTSNTSVSFNGVSATPSAVSATSITVAVPAGATSGTVSVTAPGGTVAAPLPFTVGSPAVPTITSFTTGTSTPTTASPGNSVTITGTNFDTTYSKVFINGQFAPVTSASTTSLVVTVPPGSSGKIVVETPIGSVTSSSDLIVVPPPFAISAMTASTRTTVGASAVTVSEAGTGKVQLVLFDVTPGQRFNVFLDVSSTPGCPNISLLAPNGVDLSPGFTCHNGYWTGSVIPVEGGTYSVEFMPTSSAGSFTAKVISVPADVTATLTAGTTSTLSVATPGQGAVITFSGTAAQRITLLLNFSSMTSICNTFAVLNPDRSMLIATTDTCSSHFYVTSVAIVLAQTGTYTITVAPDLNIGASLTTGTGSLSATFFVVPANATTSLTVGGSSGGMTISTPGQLGSYTFSGTSGQKISAQLGFSGMTGCSTYSMLNPDNSVLAAATDTCSNGVYVSGGAIVLAQTGTYVMAVSPDLNGGTTTSGTGSLSSRVFSVPADATTSLTIGGSSAVLTISAPGQHGSYTFSGTSGQKVSIQIGFGGMTGCSSYSVINPDNSTLVGSTSTCSNGIYVTGAPIVLSQTGTFTIAIVPDISGGSTSSGTGTLSSQVFSVPADATGSVSIGGTGATLTISTPGQHGSVTFSGTSGQHINTQFNFSSMVGCSTFSILNPDTTALFGATQTCSSTYSTGALTLSQTGTYTVAITPSISGGTVTSGTGSMVVTVNSSP